MADQEKLHWIMHLRRLKRTLERVQSCGWVMQLTLKLLQFLVDH